VRAHLASHQIESRHVWKPMHLQPAFSGAQFVGTGVAEDLFVHGLCLPSSSSEIASDVVDTLKILY